MEAVQIIKQAHAEAQKLGQCGLFTGKETLEEVAKLMLSAQGTEFMLENRFPALSTFQRLKPYRMERFGIYIDCGKISIPESRRLLLVGNTCATVCYRETAGSRLCLMHGARANAFASGYSVLRVESDEASSANCVTSDNAVVLW